ncbi:hypothetical protein [Desulforhopalus singaporensis]|uniref:hypothetical protein n=1 Tax=Desulforhopalus singaporensis TaxID=91360 RepID=UPI0015A4D530|nr:hypothetical protein [Desulforhopalus singaporensis]
MGQSESISEQIEKAEKVREEAKQNFAQNPDDFSARLLLVSIENHLADLYRQLDRVSG